jgi:hypothetical protein
MKRYFNIKGSYGVETIDELDSANFDSIKEFRKEVKRLYREYNLTPMGVYVSSRCTNEWKNS